MALLLLAVFVISVCAAARDKPAEFAKFKERFGKHYESPKEESRRFAIFSANMNNSDHLRATNPHAKFGETPFSDLTPEEFKRSYLTAKVPSNLVKDYLKVPEAQQRHFHQTAGIVDWRTTGAVGPVKNQYQCGACYAFSAIANIESHWFLAGHPFVQLGEEDAISCDKQSGNGGCSGGWMDWTWSWFINHRSGQVPTLASNPYMSMRGTTAACTTTGRVTGATISSYGYLPANEASITSFVTNNGPVSVAVDATAFQYYSSGILTPTAMHWW